MTKAFLIRDRVRPEQFRVEAIDKDGGCAVAIFAGPDALGRALAFVGGGYYDEWDDPEGLAYHDSKIITP